MLPWRPELSRRAELLAREIAAAGLPDLAAALETELAVRADKLAAGISAYRQHPYVRQVPEPPVIWSEGSTRLLDYGPPDGLPLLVVPSLINRYYVLDLMADRSFLRELSTRGIRSLLVDWGAPGERERSFDLTSYVAGRLDQAFEVAAELAGAPLALLGYCMGGLLALALGLRRQRHVSGLALLATPWDFHAGAAVSYAALLAAMQPSLEATFGPLGAVPTDILQVLFAFVDPQLAIRKFTRFARIDPKSPEAVRFVAIEDWANDGVPLAMPVMRECLGGWYGRNSPAQGEWLIAGRPVLAEDFTRPAMVVLPARDRIVPPSSAEALAERLPRATRLNAELGHVGIVTAERARAEVWAPLVSWLSTLERKPTAQRPPGRRRAAGTA